VALVRPRGGSRLYRLLVLGSTGDWPGGSWRGAALDGDVLAAALLARRSAFRPRKAPLMAFTWVFAETLPDEPTSHHAYQSSISPF
jgi:hypothetical protein